VMNHGGATATGDFPYDNCVIRFRGGDVRGVAA
jgi:hypothetical protein